jgi:hypothetical protein
MRQKVDASQIGRFMSALAQGSKTEARVYLVGGSTAVLMGWRQSTIDIDLKIMPDADDILRTISHLKDKLGINVELASPDHFIPELPGWESRSQFIERLRHVDFFHYDFYAQALAKIERGHQTDKTDVEEMLSLRLIDPEQLLQLFGKIEGQLFRYPAIDPESFRIAVEAATHKP